jgi:hypothetical protein
MASETYYKNILPVELTRACQNLLLMTKLVEAGIKVPKAVLTEVKAIPQGVRDIFAEHFKDPIYRKHNRELYAWVKKTVKQHKTASKYISEDFSKQEVVVVTPDGNVGDNLVDTFKEFIQYKDKAPCFFWQHQAKQLSWLDKKDLDDQFKRYRQLIRQGSWRVLEVNNRTFTLSKREWHCLVVTPDGCEPDIASFKLFNFYVDGFVYWFSNKNNRDSMYNYLSK